MHNYAAHKNPRWCLESVSGCKTDYTYTGRKGGIYVSLLIGRFLGEECGVSAEEKCSIPFSQKD